ncbi:MAG: hypothetical protein OEV40_12465 [Acidimicrobiia bacterium]|nr:hypothetical protein [Acidimicrobiia bacterium]
MSDLSIHDEAVLQPGRAVRFTVIGASVAAVALGLVGGVVSGAIAVMRDYSPVKYVIATALARGGRYCMIASAGAALFEVGLLHWAIWITLVVFAVGMWQSVVRAASGATAFEPKLGLSDG